MDAVMKIVRSTIPAILLITVSLGCSQDSDRKIRYDMEKLNFRAGKISERINIQPQLATPADTAALMSAHQDIIDFYTANRDNPAVAENDSIRNEMTRMALQAQLQIARLHLAARKSDLAIEAYKRIGDEIPVPPQDDIQVKLELALTYRSQEMYDSTIAIYDRLLETYYPPLKSNGKVNSDVAAIPIDRLRIVRAVKETGDVDRAVQNAVEYYARLRTDFPDNEELTRASFINASRIYTMTEQWGKALDQLQQIKDSTGATDVSAMFMMASIHGGPRRDAQKAIQIYREIIDRDADSSLIGNSMLRLGAALCALERYDEGRRVLADLKKKFERFPILAAPAQYYYAQSFDAQDRWDRSLSEFQWLMENHPYSEEAFKAAIYIPRHFQREGDDKLANIWFDRSERFFEDAARVKQGERVEMVAYTHLADLYRLQERWQKALETLEKIHALAPKSRLGAEAMYFAAAVSYNNLNDSVRAAGYLDRIRQQFGTTDSTLVLEEEETDINPESME